MRTIVVGCEYAGTTTLSETIMGWAKLTFGGEHFFHDHMKIPHISHGTLSEDDIKHFMALSPDLKEQFQRFQVEYHLQPEFYEDDDHHNVGFFIDEAVYAPLYYGYDQEGGRTWHARKIEARIMGDGAGHRARAREGLAGSHRQNGRRRTLTRTTSYRRRTSS